MLDQGLLIGPLSRVAVIPGACRRGSTTRRLIAAGHTDGESGELFRPSLDTVTA